MRASLAVLSVAWCLLTGTLPAPPCRAEDVSRGGLAARVRERLSSGRAGDRSIREILRERLKDRNRGIETAELAGRRVAIWRPGPGRPGPAPVVVFSHGFHGCATQSTFLARALADDGYLVIAPDHRDAFAQPGAMASWKPEVGLGRPDAWTEGTYRDRAEDVIEVLRALKSDPAWAAHADVSRLVLAGHSLGGYTALGLAGAWPGWKIPGVRAVLALSPYAHPFARQSTLGKLTVPVMYQTGSRDLGVAPFLKRSGGAWDQTPAPACLVDLAGAGHFAWSDLQSQAHASITHYALAFLDRHARGGAGAGLGQRRPDVADLQLK